MRLKLMFFDTPSNREYYSFSMILGNAFVITHVGTQSAPAIQSVIDCDDDDDVVGKGDMESDKVKIDTFFYDTFLLL